MYMTGRRRVLVLRGRGQISALAEALRARGMEPVLLPAIETVPPASFAALDEALGGLERFDWLLFTSANAVEVFRARLPAGVRLPRVAVIGPATAKALEGLAIDAPLMPPQAVAESLAEALLPFARGGRFLLVRAAMAREHLPETLRAAGAEVVVAAAYRTVVPAESVALLRGMVERGEWPEAVAFTSASTVRNLLALCEAAGVRLPEGVARVSIGPVTSAALREVGWVPSAEASEACVEAVAEAVGWALG